MTPKFTYELRIAFSGARPRVVKEQVKAWLTAQGADSFVEGVLDDLDIDHEFVDPTVNFYSDLGGELAPLSLYSYDQEYLHDLQHKLAQQFPGELSQSREQMETQVWMEGWKESFKPIFTQRFYIYPPWEASCPDPKLIPIVVDPGMAFGTGQHATTQLCLQALESLAPAISRPQEARVLDVGTGSGILAIAAKKLGFAVVHSCDIDPNAIIAAQSNAAANGLSFPVWKGSLPMSQLLLSQAGSPEQEGPYDVVMANILYVVLEQILEELVAEMQSQALLILSGLLTEQKPAMLVACARFGLKLEQEWEQAGWSCLAVRR